MIGYYEQVTAFSTENAGTSEWCKAKKNGRQYFIKKFQKPVYPSKDLGLSETKYEARVKRFHAAKAHYEQLYNALRSNNTSGALVVPEEVISYQFHLCTVTDFVAGNVKPHEVCKLSEWQRLVLMRTLTLAVMNVHSAGIVHGDMKPDNILITQDPKSGACVLKLIDFDSSYFTSSAPESADDIAGDMAYWAPEVLAKFTNESIVLDKSVDIFALGLILHYLWTGDIPQKPTDKTIGECMLSGNTITLAPSLPLVMNKIINGLIETDPKKRLSCQNVYDILGIQLAKYPKTITKLVSEEHIKADPAEVEILFCDISGTTFKRTPLLVEAGSSVTVKAKQFDDYVLTSADKVLVKVDSAGVPNVSVVKFIYKKKSTVGKAFMYIILLFLLIWVLVAISQNTGMGEENSGGENTNRHVATQTAGEPTSSPKQRTPATPTHRPLSLSGTSSSRLYNRIEWQSESNTVYQIERRLDSGNSWTTLDRTTSSYYVDSSVAQGVTYVYRVTAYRENILLNQEACWITTYKQPTPTPTKRAASSSQSSWLIGEKCYVNVGSGWTRYGPGISYSEYRSVSRGTSFVICDVKLCTDGTSEKDWYQIKLNNQMCWISSGIVNVNGYTNGTRNGIPIQ